MNSVNFSTKEYQSTTANRFFSRYAQVAKSKPVRTLAQFAEEEIVLPRDGGPFEGQMFRVDRQPFARLLWDELDSRQWAEAFVFGCIQSGKTLLAFVIPLVYMVVELHKGPIAAIPDGSMIADKWSVDIEPVFQANDSLQKLLPEKGPGSKGGTPKSFVKLRNGLPLKFITKGGSDQSKAGYTAPFIVLTEAAGWSEGTETSKESSPLDQVRGRQMSASKYDDDGNINAQSMLVVEGTVTDDEDLPLSEWPLTTQSRIACPCPHCKKHVTPEREHLRGWKDAPSENQAAKKSHFVCPACEKKLTEKQRRTMNEKAVLLHAGQQVKRGKVHGPAPEVSKLGFRWNAFNNLFLKASDYGTKEWTAAQFEEGSPKWENAEKALCQQAWAIGYTPKNVARTRLNQKAVRNRKSKLPDRMVPANCDYLVTGIDVGKWVCWFVTLAFCSDGTIHVVAHDGVDTSILNKDKVTKHHENIAIANCLAEMFDAAKVGYVFEDGGVKHPDLVLPDTGYRPEAVFSALREFDPKRFMGVRGRGKTVWFEDKNDGEYRAPAKLSQTIREISDIAPMHREYVRKWRAL